MIIKLHVDEIEEVLGKWGTELIEELQDEGSMSEEGLQIIAEHIEELLANIKFKHSERQSRYPGIDRKEDDDDENDGGLDIGNLVAWK